MKDKLSLKYFIFSLDLFSQEFFFCTCSLFGITYNGVGSSSIYVVYSVVLFALTMFFVLKDLIKSKRQISKPFFLLLPFIMSFIFLIEYQITPPTGIEWTWKSYVFFMLFCMPAMYVGTSMSVRKEINPIYPYMDTVLIVMALGLIRSVPTLLATGMASLTGGESSGDYNTIAYCSALCFGSIYYGLLANRPDRFGIFRSKIFRIFSVVLLPALAFASFSSGGRGGSLLLIIMFLYLTWKYFKNASPIRIAILGIPILAIVAFAAVKLVQSNSLLSAAFEHGTDRAFSYITGNGVDMSQTSNRDIIYENALNAVKEDPIAIRGFFRTIGMRGYPHNFFIEILLDGGLIYFFIWIVYLFNIFRKGYKMINRDPDLFFMMVVSLYVLVSCFFGGTYLMTGLFWFILALIHNYILIKPVGLYE